MILSSLPSLAHARTKMMHFAVFLQTATKKTAKGDCHATLKLIQHGVTITKYWLGHAAWLGIDNKIASIGGDNYWVLKKTASLCSLSVYFFVFWEPQGIPPEKKTFGGS
jgi:hypothetical protein